MDYTPSVIRWVWFVAVCAFDILVRVLSGTLACEMLLCTFYAPRRTATIVFCVPILLAPHALWNIAFDVWCLDFHHCVEEGGEFVYVLVGGMWFDVHEVDGQWFVMRCLTFQTFVTSWPSS